MPLALISSAKEASIPEACIIEDISSGVWVGQWCELGPSMIFGGLKGSPTTCTYLRPKIQLGPNPSDGPTMVSKLRVSKTNHRPARPTNLPSAGSGASITEPGFLSAIYTAKCYIELDGYHLIRSWRWMVNSERRLCIACNVFLVDAINLDHQMRWGISYTTLYLASQVTSKCYASISTTAGLRQVEMGVPPPLSTHAGGRSDASVICDSWQHIGFF